MFSNFFEVDAGCALSGDCGMSYHEVPPFPYMVKHIHDGIIPVRLWQFDYEIYANLVRMLYWCL